MSSPRSVRGVAETRPSQPADQRVAPRLEASDVPWITAVKPALDDAARLINISKTGALLDTRARLLPSRRTTFTISSVDSPPQRVQGVVVRTQLVAFVPGSGPLYRTAIRFEAELAWNPPQAAGLTVPLESVDSEVTSESAPEPHAAPLLEGPIDGLFSTEAGSYVVVVSSLTETGCLVRISTPVELGAWVSVGVFFSPVRRLLLTGTVASLVPGESCTLRFAKLTPEDRRALRVELRGQPARSGRRSVTLPTADHCEGNSGTLFGGVVGDVSEVSLSLRSNRW
jgi:hypothetical protein